MSHYSGNFINAKWLTVRRMDFTPKWREQWEMLQWCSAHLSRFGNWQKLGAIIGLWEVGAHIRRNWLANWKTCISENWKIYCLYTKGLLIWLAEWNTPASHCTQDAQICELLIAHLCSHKKFHHFI
jgi:hypothetical protein